MACRVAQVSRQAFYDWRGQAAAGPTDAEIDEARLVEEIRVIHAEHDGTYGEPRVTPELAGRGWVVNHKRVERLMAANGIVGVHKAPEVRTTIPAEDALALPDLVGRRGRVGPVVAQAQAVALPLRRPGRRPPGDLRLDQPLQHDPSALQPQLRPAPRVRGPVPSTPGRPDRAPRSGGIRGCDPRCVQPSSSGWGSVWHGGLSWFMDPSER